MSLTIPESQLPNALTPQEAVEAAYSAEMAEVAGQIARGLPTLVECDKELAPVPLRQPALAAARP